MKNFFSSGLQSKRGCLPPLTKLPFWSHLPTCLLPCSLMVRVSPLIKKNWALIVYSSGPKKCGDTLGDLPRPLTPCLPRRWIPSFGCYMMRNIEQLISLIFQNVIKTKIITFLLFIRKFTKNGAKIRIFDDKIDYSAEPKIFYCGIIVALDELKHFAQEILPKSSPLMGIGDLKILVFLGSYLSQKTTFLEIFFGWVLSISSSRTTFPKTVC